MKNNALLTKVSGPIKKIGFKVKKHSPEILILTGVTGMVVSTVLACKATTKVGEIFDKAKEDIEIINQVKSDESKADEYSRTDEIIIASRGEAEEIIDKMNEIIVNYDVVSVADLYEMIGYDKKSRYTDFNYGWSDLRGAKAVRVPDGFLLDLPRPIRL